jgi:type IV secretion system protein VirB10
MTAKDELVRLEGEEEIPPIASVRTSNGSKSLIAGAVLALSVVGVLGFAATRYFSKKEATIEKSADVASATATRVKFPDPSPVRAPKPAIPAAADTTPAASGTRVPSIEQGGDVQAQAIPVRSSTGGGTAPKRVVPPGDESPFTTPPGAGAAARLGVAPTAQGAGVAEAQANLKKYESQLGELMGQLKGVAGQAARAPAANPAGLASPVQPGQPLFGTMERSATPTVSAGYLGDRSLTMPKGTTFMCSLKTRVITATSGFVGCQVQRNVFSDDGKVVLAERGSHLDGEYRVVQVRPGVTRIPVLWTRIRMPNGVTVDLDSPATGALGESGIGGYVDNRWPERIGAALMLSLIQDAVQGASKSDGVSGGSTVVLSNTSGTGSKLAEKILESTINIPPLIYSNQGSVVGVYVARDVDFSKVYSLVPQ